jgi:hypothetical protein
MFTTLSNGALLTSVVIVPEFDRPWPPKRPPLPPSILPVFGGGSGRRGRIERRDDQVVDPKRRKKL